MIPVGQDLEMRSALHSDGRGRGGGAPGKPVISNAGVGAGLGTGK